MQYEVYNTVLFIRSAARLALNNITGALEDAKEVLTLAPRCSEASANSSSVIIFLRNGVRKLHADLGFA